MLVPQLCLLYQDCGGGEGRFKQPMWGAENSLLGKVLIAQHEELSSILCKNLGIESHAFFTSSEEAETGRGLGLSIQPALPGCQ